MSQKNHLLDTPIEFLKGVGPQRAEILQKELNVFSFRDLLEFYPFRYIDKTQFHKISELKSDLTDVQIIGKIVQVKVEGVGRKKRLKAIFEDETSRMELIWFKGVSWMKKSIQLQEEIVIFGKPTFYKGVCSISHLKWSL